MLRTLRSGAVACAAVAARLITVASVMFIDPDDLGGAVLPLHPPPSSPAKAGDPVFQRRLRSTETLRRTGSPAFAGDDGGGGRRRERAYPPGPSHSGLRGRSIVFTFSILMPPFLTRSLSGASVAPATFMR